MLLAHMWRTLLEVYRVGSHARVGVRLRTNLRILMFSHTLYVPEAKTVTSPSTWASRDIITVFLFGEQIVSSSKQAKK